jgi:hypothetical protein
MPTTVQTIRDRDTLRAAAPMARPRSRSVALILLVAEAVTASKVTAGR